MAIEIIPKKEKQTETDASSILFYVAVFFLIIALSVYFSIIYLGNKTKATMLEVKQEMIEREVKEVQDLERSILSLNKKINDFKFLLSGKQSASPFFAVLGNIAHPNVVFESFSIQILNNQGQALLSGTAQNFESLGQQIYILKDNKNIKSVVLNNISSDREGNVMFQASFVITPSL